MSDSWRLEWDRGDRYEVVNYTGTVARDVHLSTTGAVVVSGKRDWSRDYGDVPDRQGPAIVIKQGWGEPGSVVVTWTDEDGYRLTNRLPLRD